MESIPKRILGYLVKNDEVLLGEKKEGMGAGFMVGIGGKPEDLESEEQTLKRELNEEIGIIPIKFEKMGSVKFIFPHKPSWSQEVIPFIVTEWDGEPKETEEIIPHWFKKNDLPIDKMWPDAKYWIPNILQNKKVNISVSYRENDSIENIDAMK